MLDDNSMESHESRFLNAFEEYSDALFRHASIRISDREKAIDLVHDTFTKVWSYGRDGHKIDSYRSFLYKVLNNLIIDENKLLALLFFLLKIIIFFLLMYLYHILDLL